MMATGRQLYGTGIHVHQRRSIRTIQLGIAEFKVELLHAAENDERCPPTEQDPVVVAPCVAEGARKIPSFRDDSLGR